MADNYLENKFEQLQSRRSIKVVKRINMSLDTLLKKNRSYRGYDPTRLVTKEELKELVSVVSLCGSGQNHQTLRFRLVTAEESDKVLPLKPLAVIAIGKGAESIFLKPVGAGESLTYYRTDGVHFVPKLQVDDLII
ncbi:MAG: nitroreductase family protein [Bacteroidales bacterium]|nr:nitroreductase family protein [Bacteroidales bacterium]